MSDGLADTANLCQAHLADPAVARFGHFGYLASMKGKAANIGKYAENRISKIMSAKGLKLEDVAERAGVHFTTVEKLSKGKMGLTLDYMLKVAPALGVDICELIRAPEPKWAPSEATILELLAAAMLVDEDDHERRDLIQDVANKAQTVLARIAEKPEYEADRSRIVGMFETVRAAAAALPIAPTPTQKRTPDRKADSPANNEK